MISRYQQILVHSVNIGRDIVIIHTGCFVGQAWDIHWRSGVHLGCYSEILLTRWKWTLSGMPGGRIWCATSSQSLRRKPHSCKPRMNLWRWSCSCEKIRRGKLGVTLSDWLQFRVCDGFGTLRGQSCIIITIQFIQPVSLHVRLELKLAMPRRNSPSWRKTCRTWWSRQQSCRPIETWLHLQTLPSCATALQQFALNSLCMLRKSLHEIDMCRCDICCASGAQEIF